MRQNVELKKSQLEKNVNGKNVEKHLDKFAHVHVHVHVLAVSVSMDTDTDRDMDMDVDMGRFLQLNTRRFIIVSKTLYYISKLCIFYIY
jgi:hypothetical protein